MHPLKSFKSPKNEIRALQSTPFPNPGGPLNGRENKQTEIIESYTGYNYPQNMAC